MRQEEVMTLMAVEHPRWLRQFAQQRILALP
jgi:hypothetical protein